MLLFETESHGPQEIQKSPEGNITTALMIFQSPEGQAGGLTKASTLSNLTDYQSTLKNAPVENVKLEGTAQA